MDCGHYIAGGGEYNCNADTRFYHRSVCALKEACERFKDKEEEKDVVFPPIKMRKLKIKRKK